MTPSDRAQLDAMCRQIDVRKRLDGEPTEAAVVVEALLAEAGSAGVDGFGLKCVNSALKALDLRPDIPGATEMRVRAIELFGAIVDRRDA